jgi:hypothetical protein
VGTKITCALHVPHQGSLAGRFDSELRRRGRGTANKVLGVTLRVLSPRLAWALVGGLAGIALAVAVTGSLSAKPAPAPRPAPAPHVWHAQLLPAQLPTLLPAPVLAQPQPTSTSR